MKREGKQDCVLFVGTFPPRECGIATFTENLINAIDKKFFPYLRARILAINNNGINIYNYPEKVMYQLSDSDRPRYKKLAEKINKNEKIKFVSIQHEFGLFGSDYEGRPGEYLIDFLKNLNKPKIITLHSVLPSPDALKKETLIEISKHVNEIIVMTNKGVEILKNVYGITTPIRVIPHGIPTVAFETQTRAKKKLGYEGKILLSSFGMINSGKGYEYVIEALPEVIKKYPNVIYLIVGATHPVVRRNEGESYRNFLDSKIKKLELQDHVKFYNKYITQDEIITYLKATDIYMSSTLTPEQITAGTLAYAAGCGRVAISTPFLHAQDLINSERGILLKDFRNAGSFAEAIIKILEDQKLKKDIEQNVYEYTRHTTWPNVAISYGELIRKYIKLPEICFEELPKLKITHMRRLTDEFGMIQFSRYSSPNLNSGYALDDNARALLVAGKLYEKTRKEQYLALMKTYLRYIKYVQNGRGRFHCFVFHDRKINKKSWSEEAHGRAVKALGYIASIQALPKEIKIDAENMLLMALQSVEEIHSPRALASIIAGLYYYNKETYSRETIKLIKKLSNKLVDLFAQNATPDWQWFEEELTYSNSKICEALLHAHICTQEEKFLNVALKSLDFLLSQTFENGMFIPIGQNGWFKKNKTRAYFDQQPVDVASMVQTLAMGYKLTKNQNYGDKALIAFNWFLGKNTLKQVVYNEASGGCCDGLDESGINQNQGAESTLSYLLARLSLEELL